MKAQEIEGELLNCYYAIYSRDMQEFSTSNSGEITLEQFERSDRGVSAYYDLRDHIIKITQILPPRPDLVKKRLQDISVIITRLEALHPGLEDLNFHWFEPRLLYEYKRLLEDIRESLGKFYSEIDAVGNPPEYSSKSPDSWTKFRLDIEQLDSRLGTWFQFLRKTREIADLLYNHASDYRRQQLA
jgi:hypothetical protein